MEHEMQQPYTVFVKTDASNRITAINSGEFLNDTSGWIEIDRGYSSRHRHAQRNYLPQKLLTDDGIWRYALVDGKVVQRTEDELDTDRETASPENPVSDSDRLDSLEQQIDMLLKGATGDGEEA